MARDDALARCLEPGHAVLRFYQWDRPTVSFGRNEPAADRFARPDGASVDYVRRPTGGRALLHDDEVTYCVVAPLRAFGRMNDAYVAINEALVQGLVDLGVPARLTTEGRVEPLHAGPCFQSPAPGEVVVGDGKLVGSAQARIHGALLQHGSIILDGDQSRLAILGGLEFAGPPPGRVAAWADPTPTPLEVARALAASCRLAWGGRWSEAPYTSEEDAAARRVERERYSMTDWTWRR